jgi:hypothetical protein
MGNEIFTGTVYDYGRKGSPLVHLEKRIVMINGFKSAYKPPINSDIRFTLSDPIPPSNRRFGIIVDDIPRKDLGTICNYGFNGETIMEFGGKIIFAKNFADSLKIGDVVRYRIIHSSPKFDIAWVYDEPAVQSTIEGMMQVVDKMASRGNKLFSDVLTHIQNNYSSGDYKNTMFNIDRMYKLLASKDLMRNRDISNPLKFLELVLEERASLLE